MVTPVGPTGKLPAPATLEGQGCRVLDLFIHRPDTRNQIGLRFNGLQTQPVTALAHWRRAQRFTFSTSTRALPLATALDHPAGGLSANLRPGEREPRSGAAWALVVLLTLAGALLPAVLWPGDVSFINDEPRHLANAYYANKAHMLAAHGLVGNFGIPYGPVPTEIYQALLAITHDPITLACLRSGLSALVTAIALLWLARSLRLNPWFAAAVVLAPFLWVFHRILWDASWAVPMGAVALASYAAFLRSGRAAPLLLSLLCNGLLPFIHPQDLPLCLPMLLHLLFFRPRALLRFWPGVLGVVLICIWLNKWYLLGTIHALQAHLGSGVKNGYPGTNSRLLAMLAPLWGGRFLSGDRYMVGFPATGAGLLVNAGKVVSYVVFGLIWAGIAIVAVRWFHRQTVRHQNVQPSSPATLRPRPTVDFERRAPRKHHVVQLDPTAARDTISYICLVGLLMQMGIFGIMRVPPEPQYFFGTFPIFVIFAWITIDALSHWRVANGRLGGAAIAVYGASVAAITLGSMWWFHGKPDMLHPPRPLPNLGAQVALAKALNAYDDTTALTDLRMNGLDQADEDFYQRYPQALRSLRLLMPPTPGVPQKHSGHLLIRYGPGPGGPETHLEVIDLGDAPPPKGAEPMDITPLPEGWEPKY